jgi:prevent-host-death family protein
MSILKEGTMKEIGAAKFKEQCLALLDNLDADGLIVTKRGKPVARLIPYEVNDGDLIGSLRGKLKIKGDIFTTGIRWDADDQS